MSGTIPWWEFPPNPPLLQAIFYVPLFICPEKKKGLKGKLVFPLYMAAKFSVTLGKCPTNLKPLVGLPHASDIKIPGVPAPYPDKYGFCLYLIGGPGTGKSSVACSLIREYYMPQMDFALVWSPSSMEDVKKFLLEDDKKAPIQFHKGGMNSDYCAKVIDAINNDEDAGPSLFYLDDLVAGIKRGDEVVENLFWNRRHIGGSISLIVTAQVFNTLEREIRKSATHVILLTNDPGELDAIRKDFLSISKAQFAVIADEAIQKDHDFLYISGLGKKPRFFKRNMQEIFPRQLR
jgi:hypothetical protein